MICAFDCFGTVFDMTVPHEEIKDYVRHVRQNDFTPYEFPASWYSLVAHADSAEGIRLLQSGGIKCVALSNGAVDLIARISEANNIHWDHIVDLVAHKVYKPHLDAYRSIEKDLGVPPEDTIMVTANPTFGDVEGSQAIGMKAQVIRHGYPHTIIDLARMLIFP